MVALYFLFFFAILSPPTGEILFQLMLITAHPLCNKHDKDDSTHHENPSHNETYW